MKLGLLKEVDWQYIGASLAKACDDEQVEFFKAFVKECQVWGTHYQVENQLAGVNLKLTKDEREVLSMLGYEDKNEE